MAAGGAGGGAGGVAGGGAGGGANGGGKRKKKRDQLMDFGLGQIEKRCPKVCQKAICLVVCVKHNEQKTVSHQGTYIIFSCRFYLHMYQIILYFAWKYSDSNL